MRHLLFALAVAIVLGGSFGEASADGRLVAGGLEADFEVEVAGTPAAVVVHVVDPGHDQQTFSLIERGGGRWGGIAVVEPNNYVIVFEALYADGDGELSDPTTLSELGVDPEVLGITVEPAPGGDEEEGLSKASLRRLWAAVALGATALALLAVWALGDRKDRVSESGGLPEEREPAAGGPVPEPEESQPETAGPGSSQAEAVPSEPVDPGSS